MKLQDLNLIKRSHEIESIRSDIDDLKSRFSQLVICLEEREKTLLESIDSNHKAYALTGDLIEKQHAAIDKLESLNSDKEKKLSGLSRWLILAVLGGMSLTAQYSLNYDQGTGIIVTPKSDASPVLPWAYTAAIIALATGQDDKIGHIIENIGKKIGG